MMFKSLFPGLTANTPVPINICNPLPTFASVDLNLVARKWQDECISGNHPNFPGFTKPDDQETLIKRAALGRSRYTYGGWLEDRRVLMRETYLAKEKKWVHLGVDFNVPEGTLVRCPKPMTILYEGHDKNQDGGWGHRVVARAEDRTVYVFAHLRPDLVTEPSEGQILLAGTTIGFVGGHHENGGWWPHLHVQAINPVNSTFSGLEKVDGYCSEEDAPKMMRIFPDPIPLLFG